MKKALDKIKLYGTVNGEGGVGFLVFFEVDLLRKIRPFPELLETLSAESDLMTSNRQQFKCT